MTEAELVESITSYYDLAGGAMSLYVTVSTGYLIAAYLIGSKLTSSQMIVISTLYAFITGVQTYAIFGYMSRAFSYVEMQRDLNPDLVAYSSPIFYILMPAIFGAGILACLKFMWDIRHPKN